MVFIFQVAGRLVSRQNLFQLLELRLNGGGLGANVRVGMVANLREPFDQRAQALLCRVIAQHLLARGLIRL